MVKTETLEANLGEVGSLFAREALRSKDLVTDETATIRDLLVTHNSELSDLTVSGKARMQDIDADGLLRAREVRVNLEAWPDYVFGDTYELKPLAEVESFINENKHLPGIPAAGTVEKEGVNIGAMQALLLQKIEELTLHCIRLEKEVTKLQNDKE